MKARAFIGPIVLIRISGIILMWAIMGTTGITAGAIAITIGAIITMAITTMDFSPGLSQGLGITKIDF